MKKCVYLMRLLSVMKNLFNIILCKILGHHYIDKGFKMVERGKLFD
jgi:hypothetical protein